MSNELTSLQKTVTVLDEKFKFLLKEDRKKDEFMVGFFKRTLQNKEDLDLLTNFFKQYEEVPKLTLSELLSQERQVQEQLRAEIKSLNERIEIDELIQKNLRKEIMEMGRGVRY